MDRQIDKRDLKLLENDKYTFAVLSRILGGRCRLTLTDHERFIICHSENPYPVWIWTPDDVTVEECERVFDIITQALPITDGYRYNMKYDLADFFITKAKVQGINLKIAVNMFAYECKEPIEPQTPADGHLHLCAGDDIKEAIKIFAAFHEEINADRMNDSEITDTVRKLINGKQLYFWKNSSERTVASCYYITDNDVASVSGVYTFSEYRRNHYAQNLVYQVTKIIESKKAIPMLYTDADYAASNACYEKIGYVRKGSLCTIGIG